MLVGRASSSSLEDNLFPLSPTDQMQKKKIQREESSCLPGFHIQVLATIFFQSSFIEIDWPRGPL